MNSVIHDHHEHLGRQIISRTGAWGVVIGVALLVSLALFLTCFYLPPQGRTFTVTIPNIQAAYTPPMKRNGERSRLMLQFRKEDAKAVEAMAKRRNVEMEITVREK